MHLSYPLVLNNGGTLPFLPMTRIPAFAPLMGPLGCRISVSTVSSLPSSAGIWRRLMEGRGEKTEPSGEREEQLFREFREQRDEKRKGMLRVRIRNEYAPLVGLVLKIAKYEKGERDEARQSAELSLLEAVDAFSTDPSIRFSDFAFERMRKAVEGGDVSSGHAFSLDDERLVSHEPDAASLIMMAELRAEHAHAYDEAVRRARDGGNAVPPRLEEAVRDFLRQRGDVESLAEIAVRHGVPLQLVIDAVWRLASSHEALREIAGHSKRIKRKKGVPRDRPKVRPSLLPRSPGSPGSSEDTGKISYLEYRESLCQRVALLEEAVKQPQPDMEQQRLHEIVREVRERLLRDWEEWRREFAEEDGFVSNFLPTYALFALAHYGREIPLSVTYIEWVFVNAREHFRRQTGVSASDEEWHECRHVLIRFLSTQSVRRGRGYREEATPQPLLSAGKVKTSLGEAVYSRFRDYLLHELGRHRLPPYEKSFLYRRLLDLYWVYGDGIQPLPFHRESYRNALTRDFGFSYSPLCQEIFLGFFETDIRRQGLEPSDLIWEEGRRTRELGWEPLSADVFPRMDSKSAPEQWAGYVIQAIGACMGSEAIHWLDQRPIGVLGQTIVFLWGKNSPGDWRLLNSLLVYLQAEKARRVMMGISNHHDTSSVTPMDPWDAFRRAFADQCPLAVEERDGQEVIVIPVPRLFYESLRGGESRPAWEDLSLPKLLNLYLDGERGTYEDLARQWGVSAGTVRLYSKGHIQKMRIENLRDLAQALSTSEEQKARLWAFLFFLRFQGFFEANFAPPFPSRISIVLEPDPEPLRPLAKTARVEFQREPIASVLAGVWDELIRFFENYVEGFGIIGASAVDISIPDAAFRKFLLQHLSCENVPEGLIVPGSFSLPIADLRDLVGSIERGHLLYSLRLRNWFEGEDPVSREDKNTMVQFYRMTHRLMCEVMARPPQGRLVFGGTTVNYRIVPPSRDFPCGVRIVPSGGHEIEARVVAADLMELARDERVRHLLHLRLIRACREFPGFEGDAERAYLEGVGVGPERSEILRLFEEVEKGARDWNRIVDFLVEPMSNRLRRVSDPQTGFHLPRGLANPEPATPDPVSMTVERLADQVFGDYVRAWWMQAGIRFVDRLDWEESLVGTLLDRRLENFPDFQTSRDRILGSVKGLVEGFNGRSPHPQEEPRTQGPLDESWVSRNGEFLRKIADEIPRVTPEIPPSLFLRHVHSLLLDPHPLTPREILGEWLMREGATGGDRVQREVREILLLNAYESVWKYFQQRAALIDRAIERQERKLSEGEKTGGRKGFCEEIILSLLEEDPGWEMPPDAADSPESFLVGQVRALDILASLRDGFPQSLQGRLDADFSWMDQREKEALQERERQRALEQRREEEAREKALVEAARLAELRRRAEGERQRLAAEAAERRRRAEELAQKEKVSAPPIAQKTIPPITRESLEAALAGPVVFSRLDDMPELALVSPQELPEYLLQVLGEWFDLSSPTDKIGSLVDRLVQEEMRDLVRILAMARYGMKRFPEGIGDRLENFLFEVGERMTSGPLGETLAFACGEYSSLRAVLWQSLPVFERIGLLPEVRREGPPVTDARDAFGRLQDFIARRRLPDAFEGALNRESERLCDSDEEVYALSTATMEKVSELYLQHRGTLLAARVLETPRWAGLLLNSAADIPEEMRLLIDRDFPELHMIGDEGFAEGHRINQQGALYLLWKVRGLFFDLDSYRKRLRALPEANRRSLRCFEALEPFFQQMKGIARQVEGRVRLGWPLEYVADWGYQQTLKTYRSFRENILKAIRSHPHSLSFVIEALPEVQDMPEPTMAFYGKNRTFPDFLPVAVRLANALLRRPTDDPHRIHVENYLKEACHDFYVHGGDDGRISAFREKFSLDIMNYYLQRRREMRGGGIRREVGQQQVEQEDLQILRLKIAELSGIPPASIARWREKTFSSILRTRMPLPALKYHEEGRGDIVDRIDWIMARVLTEDDLRKYRLFAIRSAEILGFSGIEASLSRNLVTLWALQDYLERRDSILETHPHLQAVVDQERKRQEFSRQLPLDLVERLASLEEIRSVPDYAIDYLVLQRSGLTGEKLPDSFAVSFKDEGWRAINKIQLVLQLMLINGGPVSLYDDVASLLFEKRDVRACLEAYLERRKEVLPFLVEWPQATTEMMTRVMENEGIRSVSPEMVRQQFALLRGSYSQILRLDEKDPLHDLVARIIAVVDLPPDQMEEFRKTIQRFAFSPPALIRAAVHIFYEKFLHPPS